MKIKMIRRMIDGHKIRVYTNIGWCITCGKPFEKIGKGTGSRKYCEVCSINAKRASNRRSEKNRPERKDYKRELAVKLRGEGRVIDTRQGRSNMVGKPPEEPTDKDWMEYHNKIKKMKKDTIGGYQDYYDIGDEDEDYNPYQ